MASTSSSFLEENKDFVLKLKIKAGDGTTQIRRIRLPRLADANGNVSYQELVGLVVVFTFPDAGAPENYSVSLTYYDVDEDMVTIASSDELVDAIEQFAGQKVLRITTYVKPKASSGIVPPQDEAKKRAPVSADRGSTARTDPPIPLQNVLESFVGVLSAAVNHLQEGLSAPAVEERASCPTADVGVTTSATDENVNSNSNDAASTEVSSTPPSEAARGETQEEYSEQTAQDNTDADEEEDEEEQEHGERFIHGRHTCDSCLTTPIIGKRYHSTNLPDYDLCHKCFSNYGGSEIQFESVELERDRAFQSRWRQRHKRSQQMMKRHAGRFVRGRGPRGRFSGNIPRGNGPGFANPPLLPPPPPGCPHPPPTPPHGHPHPPPPPPHGHPHPPPPPPHGHPHPPPYHHYHGLPHPPPHHMSPGFFNHHWAHVGPHLASHNGPHLGPYMHTSAPAVSVNGVGDFDNALKEAIRRSLRDIAYKEAEIDQGVKSTHPSAPAEDPIMETMAVMTVETVADEESVENIEAGIPRSVEIVEQEEVEKDMVDQCMAKDVGAVAEEPSFDEAEEASAMEKLMDDASVDSEKLLADDAESAKINAPAQFRSASDRKTSETSKDESFASDAVGNGDVAEAMGAALDKVAGVICEMLSEVDDGKKIRSDVSNSTNCGEVIVNSTGADMEEDEKDDGDWSVVKSVRSTETTESEQIAKAAEMLGSALFNSDMKNSEEEGYALSGSESFSIPSSVPSDLATHVSQAAPTQLNRWAAQLSQLREFGFEDESACVDVLERLEAANNGVGSDEEVYINKVINELLELQN